MATKMKFHLWLKTQKPVAKQRIFI